MEKLIKQNVELKLKQEAFYGTAGDYCKFLIGKTEADPSAILIQILTMYGNIVGPSPHMKIEADIHRAKLFSIIVGKSAKARKGTSFGLAKLLFKESDKDWLDNCIKSGLSSGEGLIHHVRDVNENNDHSSIKIDRRLLIEEPEFASVLKMNERQGNTLSTVIRKAWDDNTLSTLAKNSPDRASNTHISIIGHITIAELKKLMSKNDTVNGFANRFLWFYAERKILLPHGGDLPEPQLSFYKEAITNSIAASKNVGEVKLDLIAKKFWSELYPHISRERSGATDSVLSRGEPLILRLALIYALIDQSKAITVDHLRAANAIWDYCEQTVELLFSGASVFPAVEKLLEHLKNAGKNGMTRTEIVHGVFSGNKKQEELMFIFEHIYNNQLAYKKTEATEGRPREVWYATQIP